MKKYNLKNIQEYNCGQDTLDKIPNIFIFVDEICYLIESKQIDKLLCLVNNGRRAGISIIAGTSILDKSKSLCGKVKSNFIDRVCFKVDSKEESKLVIDNYGAEKLNEFDIMINDKRISELKMNI